ncbi:MAG: OmpA family protein [Rhodospirillales bacterium]|nr:OmpA family protein [Rhodospirillales bacterium]
MLRQRFFRGVLLVFCAQIPLIGFFIYLLFLGVGIADFANLASLRTAGEVKSDIQDDSQTANSAAQLEARMTGLNAKIAELDIAITGLAGRGQGWDRFVAQAGAETQKRTDIQKRIATEINKLAVQLSSLAQQVAGLDKSLGAQGGDIAAKMADISARVEDLKADTFAGMEELRTAAAAQEDRLEVANAQLRDEFRDISPPPYVAPPKRKPVVELRFEAEDWKIGKVASGQLDRIVRTIRNSGAGVGVRIYGFTVKQGSLNFNMALADKRARAVADVLREKGIKRNPITIYVVPEYDAYRDQRDGKSTDKIHAVHINIDDPADKETAVKG